MTLSVQQGGTYARVQDQLTGMDGSYSFTQLPAGTYQLTETQPMKFLDGKDSAGSPAGTVVAPDTITHIPLAIDQAGTQYDFGERGLRPEYISKRLALSSTPTTPDQIQLQIINDPPVVRLNGSAAQTMLRLSRRAAVRFRLSIAPLQR